LNVIETKRLLLAPLDVSRLEEFVALTADPEVMRYWGPRGPFSRDVAERNFAASLARVEEHGFGRRWIVNKESGAGLGFTETKYFGESCDDVSPDEVEIGWMLTRSAWGHGYATEAGAAVRDEAFVSLELESIVAVHHPANSASGRIMEKLGMEFERDVVTTTGWPYRLYRLTREHWASGQ
jgi:RimJ/RimL family protein N-acetyltransferase